LPLLASDLSKTDPDLAGVHADESHGSEVGAVQLQCWLIRWLICLFLWQAVDPGDEFHRRMIWERVLHVVNF